MNTKSTPLILFIVIIGIAGFIIFSPSDNNAKKEHHSSDEMVAEYEIYPGDVAQKIEDDENIVLLDVRTLEEYEEIHLKDARLLPVQKLSAQTLAEIGLGNDAKTKEIIIYCRSGARSKTAYGIMKSLGYTNIKSVAGGMIHWQEDNYPFTEISEYEGIGPPAGGETTPQEFNGPKIEFDRVLHDFGVIPQYGGIVETTFIIKNEGTETLVIGDITTSCSCTSAQISSREIPTESEAELTVIFDPDFHEEPFDVFKRTVFIPTNDPNNPEAEVTIQVDIDEGQ